MQSRSSRSWACNLVAAILTLAAFHSASRGDELPIVLDVEFQPLSAQAKRVAEALVMLGEPLSREDAAKLEKAIDSTGGAQAIRTIQEVLDRRCLIGIEINPESRVKAVQGPAAPRLVQSGWSIFLVKVHNEAGVTAALAAESPNAVPVFRVSSGRPDPKPSVRPSQVLQRWMDLAMFNDRPLTRTLSGLSLEYRIIQLHSRDAGKREAKISFNVGQGTQDLGFRSDVDILFQSDSAVTVVLGVRDEDGRPTTASFIFRDRMGRVYPSPGRRLAPDFFFHPQIYRSNGETVALPPGRYEVEVRRGPEYLVTRRTIEVPNTRSHREGFQLRRWINLAKMGWYSGDHHVHAAGCATTRARPRA